MKMFWMVYRDGGQAPTRKHDTLQAARDEAERLSRTTGRSVHVLQLLGTTQLCDVRWEPATSMGEDS